LLAAPLTGNELALLTAKQAQNPELLDRMGAGCQGPEDPNPCYSPGAVMTSFTIVGGLIGSFFGMAAIAGGAAVGLVTGYALTR